LIGLCLHKGQVYCLVQHVDTRCHVKFLVFCVVKSEINGGKSIVIVFWDKILSTLQDSVAGGLRQLGLTCVELVELPTQLNSHTSQPRMLLHLVPCDVGYATLQRVIGGYSRAASRQLVPTPGATLAQKVGQKAETLGRNGDTTLISYSG